MNRNKLHILMAAAGAIASGAAAGGAAPAPAAPGGAAPDSNVAGAEKAKRAPKTPENTLNIINGRLPLPLVFLIRFKETATVADSAKKYGTSVGKVFDIKKNRNFGYITDAYKPAADEMAAAVAWCETGKTAKGQSLKDAGGDPDGIKTLLKGMTVATAEEVAARGWNIRQVGVAAAAGTAPVAGTASAAGAAAPAADGKTGAKLF